MGPRAKLDRPVDEPWPPEPLDDEAAQASLQRWLIHGKPAFLATVLLELDCGHLRPMNAALDLGSQLDCLWCGELRRIIGKERLEQPTVFPMPDALADLPTTGDR